MIRTKRELKFYIMADYMMNRGCFKPSLSTRLRNLLMPDYIMKYLIAMRYACYYTSKNYGLLSKMRALYWGYVQRKLGVKLGFSIAKDAFGYGLLIPHYGTIVVGGGTKFGNYCVLHTSTCITHGSTRVGDAFYLSTGAKVVGSISLGNNVTIAANSLVNRSFTDDNVLLAGIPSVVKKEIYKSWIDRDGDLFKDRVRQIEELKVKMSI